MEQYLCSVCSRMHVGDLVIGQEPLLRMSSAHYL